MELLNTAAHDAVTEMLAALRVRSSVYCLSDLREPWGFEVDGSSVAKFHLVLEGSCWLRLDDCAPVCLRAGDLVVLSRGDRHAVADRPESPVEPLEKIVAGHPLDESARLSYGGDGGLTRLLCGGFTLDDPAPVTLLSLLPRVLQVSPASGDTVTWAEPVLSLARQEAGLGTPGVQAIFARLADVFLAQALRTYLVAAEPPVPARAIDPQIWQALRLLQEKPAVGWTLDGLATRVGMSRTLFATRFRAAVGDSPMRHLAKIRLSQAAGYLATTSLGVQAIANRTGYGTSASLSKAFKREFGSSPGQYRASRKSR
jgi:AraC-like DNA-binding protein